MVRVGQRVVRFLLKIFSAYIENISGLLGFSSEITDIRNLKLVQLPMWCVRNIHSTEGAFSGLTEPRPPCRSPLGLRVETKSSCILCGSTPSRGQGQVPQEWQWRPPPSTHCIPGSTLGILRWHWDGYCPGSIMTFILQTRPEAWRR